MNWNEQNSIQLPLSQIAILRIRSYKLFLVLNLANCNRLLTNKMILFLYWCSFACIFIVRYSVIIVLWVPNRSIKCCHRTRFLKSHQNLLEKFISKKNGDLYSFNPVCESAVKRSIFSKILRNKFFFIPGNIVTSKRNKVEMTSLIYGMCI